MTEYIEKLKREVETHVSDRYARTVLSAVRYAIDYLNSRGLIVQEGFTQMPNESTREIDNAYHSALPCTFDVAYRAMIATQKKED